jgi:hypothetical protein
MEDWRPLLTTLAASRDFLGYARAELDYDPLPFALQAVCLELVSTSMRVGEIEPTVNGGLVVLAEQIRRLKDRVDRLEGS